MLEQVLTRIWRDGKFGSHLFDTYWRQRKFGSLLCQQIALKVCQTQVVYEA